MKNLKLILLNLLIIFSVLTLSCRKDHCPEKNCPCINDNQPPLYNGCLEALVDAELFACAQEAMLQKMYSNVEYPPEARENCIEGRAVVLFDISKNGTMTNFSTTNDTLGFGIEEAAIIAAKSLAEAGWCPALKNCEPVEFRFSLPISFKLGK